ncbi:MAG: hypothetical protein ACP5GS_08475 [Nitrososphaeria archaeon]
MITKEQKQRTCDSVTPPQTTQHRVFYIRFFHPEYSLLDIAQLLGISHDAARKAWSRLKKNHNISKLCPICFTESFDGTVCHNCGFEHSENNFSYELREDNHHERVHRILPNHGLGEEVDYDKLTRALHLRNSPLYLKHIIENAHADTRRYEKMKAQLLEEIMETSLYIEDADKFTEYVSKIFDQQYYYLKKNYPELFNSKNAYRAIARKVKEIIRRTWQIADL